MRLKHEVILPEPLTLSATLSPQTAVWVHGHVAAACKVTLQLRVRVTQLARSSRRDVGQPVGREEADSNQDDSSRQRHRAADEEKVCARHDVTNNDAFLYTLANNFYKTS